MKVAAALATLLLLGGCASLRGRSDPAAHWAGLAILGPLEAGLLYGLRTSADPDPRLALAWGDVCGERDEAARQAAMAASRPRLEAATRQAWKHETWTMPVRQQLGAYDLQRRGFPTGVRNGSVIRFEGADFCRQGLAFLVAFRNGDKFSTLKVSEDGARQFVRGNSLRTVVHDLEVVVVGTQPGPPGPTLLVDVVRMRTRDALSERVIFDTALPEPLPGQ
ncbi:MAG: DUF4852 domain-containing protein [Anaeromyxobacter sp.]|nr:DUF4852 domain-containing protein [Anaeromyxobacter sp.]MBL0276709.1 DUF4852 domain-containing protein [Anaeromyxobacter sp.]